MAQALPSIGLLLGASFLALTTRWQSLPGLGGAVVPTARVAVGNGSGRNRLVLARAVCAGAGRNPTESACLRCDLLRHLSLRRHDDRAPVSYRSDPVAACRADAGSPHLSRRIRDGRAHAIVPDADMVLDGLHA